MNQKDLLNNSENRRSFVKKSSLLAGGLLFIECRSMTQGDEINELQRAI